MKNSETRVMKTSHELFQKHFGDVAAVSINHPNIEAFFDELSELCNEENRRRLEKDIEFCRKQTKKEKQNEPKI